MLKIAAMVMPLRAGCPNLGEVTLDAAELEHVPEKHVLGLDPMGGNRFSEKGMRQQRDLEHFPIPLDREMV
jgi:hypothetical protein